MNETERIDEDLRQYKLFKIQRANTHSQKFRELKKDFAAIQKNEILNYMIAFSNIIIAVFSTVTIFRLITVKNYFNENKELIFANVILVFLFSLFLTYKFWDFNTKLKKYKKIAGDAENHFEKESEILRSVYEGYVNNYLDSRKRR
ncbi:hypothetical protein [Chryseobacterium sp. sg2396]|uniref:hypothetical protein n=1 Tax=Chryseobacterium sp. sg2396 TaxID=3276280 RepID=UPI00366E49B7